MVEAEHLRDVLGVEPFARGGRVDQVAEQHADDLPRLERGDDPRAVPDHVPPGRGTRRARADRPAAVAPRRRLGGRRSRRLPARRRPVPTDPFEPRDGLARGTVRSSDRDRARARRAGGHDGRWLRSWPRRRAAARAGGRRRRVGARGCFAPPLGALAVLASRPLPLLAETVAIVAGASSLRWSRAMLAAALGSLPEAVAYSLAGSIAPTFENAGVIW
jgi:hypothetical protein